MREAREDGRIAARLHPEGGRRRPQGVLRTGEYDDGRIGAISSTCTRKAPPSLLHQQLRIAVSLACNTACRWRSMVDAFHLTRFEPAGPVQGTTRSSTRPRSSTMCFREHRGQLHAPFDLAHVDPPSPTRRDGQRREEGKDPSDATRPTNICPRDLTRSRTDKLVVMRRRDVDARASATSPRSPATAPAPAPPTRMKARSRLKQESSTICHRRKSWKPCKWSKSGPAPAGPSPQARPNRRAEAKAKGYEGEMCSDVRQLHAGAQRTL